MKEGKGQNHSTVVYVFIHNLSFGFFPRFLSISYPLFRGHEFSNADWDSTKQSLAFILTTWSRPEAFTATSIIVHASRGI